MMSHRSFCKSNFLMHCFSCNSPIYKGDEITQCIESGGMELRRVPYTGSRWVHMFCLPTDITTMHFLDCFDDLKNTYPDMSDAELLDVVENYDYWIHQQQPPSDNTTEQGRTSPSTFTECDMSSYSDDNDDNTISSTEQTMNNVKSILKWISQDASEQERLFMEISMQKLFSEKKEFDKIVDETLEILSKQN